MKYVLGIDSGGTKYLIRAAALDGTPLASHVGEPANHYMLPMDEVVRRIEASINACLAAFGGTRADCRYIVSGAAGVDSEEDQAIVEGIYRGLPGFCCPVHCVNDGELAHYTATNGEGLLLIAGTGSVAFGASRDGRQHRVGGWPVSAFGDEGAGRHVDAMALHLYTRYLDGVGERTPLIEHMERVTGAKTLKALTDYAMWVQTPPWPTPGVGEAVAKEALSGDPDAMRILDRAAACNFDMIDALAGVLGYGPRDAFKVGLWGSTIVKGDYQRARFAALLHEAYPHAQIVIADRDAAQGAIAWALELLGKKN